MSRNILPHALKTPVLEKLKDKRIVLASASPRRRDILRAIVRTCTPQFVWEVANSLPHCLPLSPLLHVHHYVRHRQQGIDPDIVPSTFEENLSPGSFPDIHEYPVATATHKGVEVYEKLVVRLPTALLLSFVNVLTRR